MLGMGHYEAAGNIDVGHPEIHAAMTAARACIYQQRLRREPSAASSASSKPSAARRN